jgi:radical SAM protein with 4Fe4S-binding SPASM domain
VWHRNDFGFPDELPLPGIRDLFSRLSADAPGAGITLTGGEPLLRDDLPEIAAAARETGFAVAVATNGLLLTPALAGELFRSGVRHFDIGVETSLPEASRGIAGASGTGASVTVCYCLTSRSCENARDVVGLAAALGADAVCLNRFVPTGGPEDGLLTPSSQELEEAFRSAGGAAVEFSLPVYAGIPMEPCAFPSIGDWGIILTRCNCGEGKWAIGPDGGLRTCEQSPMVLGNLLNAGFSTLRLAPEVNWFREEHRRGVCRNCGVLPSCGGGCRFLARLELQ